MTVAQPLPFREEDESVVLLASGAKTVTSTGEAPVRLQSMIRGIAFTLDVTVDEETVDDLLDVFVQTRLDRSNWTDVVHFPQHLGNAGVKRYIEKVVATPAVAGFEVGTALGAGAVRDLIGDAWRVRFVIDDDSASASFTFAVTACPG